MPTFQFTLLTSNPDSDQFESACLGVDADHKLTDNDIGKCLKLAASNNYVLCATTNEIEGILVSTEPATYNTGFAFGTVQRKGRALAKVGANQGGSAMAVGDLVVADTQAAIDTAGGAVVITGTPSTFKWRVLRIVSGTGVAGDSVLIERV
jgi:hypothetical protein